MVVGCSLMLIAYWCKNTFSLVKIAKITTSLTLIVKGQLMYKIMML